MTDPHQPLFASPDTGLPPGPVGYPQIGTPNTAQGQDSDRDGRVPAGFLIACGAAVVVIVSVVVGVVTLTKSPAPERFAGPVETPSLSDQSGEPVTGTRQVTSTAVAPVRVVPPQLVRTPDSYGETCSEGFHLSGQSGWASSSGRGSAETSCAFARSVLFAYWEQHGIPSRQLRTVVVPGTVPCPTTGGRCAGDDFIMECTASGSDPWIACTGGRNARVYLY